MCASVPQHPVTPVSHLSIDEKVGQMFVVLGRGVFMNESSWPYQELLRQVRENHIGGVIWSVSNVYETAQLTARLQKESRIPLLVSADLESGIGMRFLDTTYWPWAMAVAATGDPSLAEAEGRVVAREAKLVGINHIYAPIAARNGTSSTCSHRARSPFRIGNERCESTCVSPCPGKCLAVASTCSDWTPLINATTNLLTSAGSSPKLRVLMTGLSGSTLTSATGA